MDEERQETADWRIVWQMFFPCVISDLIGGCVEVLGHLEGNAGRTVSSFLTFAVIYPFYWRRIQKGREKWIFLGKSAGCVENPAGGSCVQRCV